MKLYDEISNILKESPVPPTNSLEQHGYGDDGQPRVALSDTAPEHLKELGDEAILVSEIPLKIKFPDAEDIYTVYPSDIVLENVLTQSVVQYAKQYISYLTGGKGLTITEAKSGNPPIAIYGGRFQPAGQHHYKTYQWLAGKFGAENTYIVTSDVTGDKSPFSFAEKKKIWQSYGVPSNKIVKVKSPYKAEELTKQFPEDTPTVFAFGKKDAGRLTSGKYFQDYKEGQDLVGYRDGGYIVVAPHVSIKLPAEFGEMSGTSLRAALGSKDLEDSKKMKLFKSVFGHTKKNIYSLIVNKLMSK